ncbi:hypothetical protein GGF39_003215, partial [Coemansia sp. RSA 1721]
MHLLKVTSAQTYMAGIDNYGEISPADNTILPYYAIKNFLVMDFDSNDLRCRTPETDHSHIADLVNEFSKIYLQHAKCSFSNCHFGNVIWSGNLQLRMFFSESDNKLYLFLDKGAVFRKKPSHLFSSEAIAKSLVKTFDPDLDKATLDDFVCFALFLQHCVNKGSYDVAQAVFNEFCKKFDIGNKDIHVVASQRGLDEELASNPGTASYLDQARWIVDVYGPLIGDFVEQMSDFMQAESRDNRLVRAYPKGLCVSKWINNTLAVPDSQYLISSPVSIPLVGLVQLMQFMVLYKTLGVTPGELARRFDVATGHSQGITSAVLLSTLTDVEDSFVSGSKKALGLWMLTGALPQLAFPYFRLNQRRNSPQYKNVDAKPTPMVSVQGLTRSQLTKIIDNFNAGQPASVAGNSSRVQLAVANTVDRFIVAGQLEHVAKFARYAKSQSAEPEKDQSKLPLALRKPVISVNFLGITVPYHCNPLKNTANDIHAVVLEKEWTFDSADMQIPVRSCDDGHDVRTEPDLTAYLIQSMCVQPVDWPRAVTAPDITHAVYFGTDGLHGFARLTFNNIEGRGIPVICAGVVSAKSPRLPHIGTN